MPTLADTLTSVAEHLRTARRSPRAADARRATAASGSEIPSIMTANSSPPSRAHVSSGRRQLSSRRATSISSSSPAAWPRLSLTVLKSSRSTKRTANRFWRRTPAVERVADAVGEERAVREPGQRVVERLVAELRLEPPALGDVSRGDDDARDVLVVEEVVEDALELDGRPVLLAEREVARRRRGGRGEHLPEELGQPGAGGVGEELGEPPADELVLRRSRARARRRACGTGSSGPARAGR